MILYTPTPAAVIVSCENSNLPSAPVTTFSTSALSGSVITSYCCASGTLYKLTVATLSPSATVLTLPLIVVCNSETSLS